MSPKGKNVEQPRRKAEQRLGRGIMDGSWTKPLLRWDILYFYLISIIMDRT